MGGRIDESGEENGRKLEKGETRRSENWRMENGVFVGRRLTSILWFEGLKIGSFPDAIRGP